MLGTILLWIGGIIGGFMLFMAVALTVYSGTSASVFSYAIPFTILAVVLYVAIQRNKNRES